MTQRKDSGGRLSYTDCGNGNPVVLLHGIPGSRRTWSKVIPLLSPRSRVLAPDLMGFGASPDAPPGAHATQQAEAVLRMLDSAGVGAAHVVGFDFGGPVAIALHRLAADRINRLTVIATNLLADTPVPLPLRIARVPVAGELAFRGLFSRAGLRILWRMATADRTSFTLQMFEEAVDPRGNATSRRIFIHSLRHMEIYAPIEQELEKIAVPVKVIWGDRDPFFPVAGGERTAARFRSAIFVTLRGCGHFLPGEKPREVAAEILS